MEKTSSIASPTSAVELFSNIKSAIDRGLLLQSNFYEPSNLVLFFGAKNVSLSVDSNSQKQGELRGFDHIGRAVRVGDRESSGFDFFFFWREEKQRVVGRIMINAREDDFISTDAIENIFGRRWVADMGAPSESTLFERTSPGSAAHATSAIKYEIKNASDRVNISMTFAANGNLRTAIFETERNP